MNVIISIIGAYIVMRLAQRRSKPGQQPSLPDTTTLYLDQYKVSLVNRFMPLIQRTANILEIPPDILWAMIYMVSSGDEGLRIVTSDGEYGYGLTQITCSRAKAIASSESLAKDVTLISDCRVLGSPANSIWYGAVYLRSLFLKDADGSWLTALARYYSPTMSAVPHEQSLLAAQRTLLVAQTFRKIVVK
jgi:hypothetical protein